MLAAPCARNLLENGDFSRTEHDIPEAWGLEAGAKRVVAGKTAYLAVDSSIAQYATAMQYLPLDGRRVKQVRLAGRVTYHDVRTGAEEYDVLRAFVIWFAENGREVGNYGDALSATGASTGWTSFDECLEVPAEARRAAVIVGLHDCPGHARFANLSLTVTQGDAEFDPRKAAQVDTTGWWPFTAAETPAAGTPLDLSSLADAPAGKRGFLTVKDGHFYFQDGTRARFWGFDIMAEECFPDHATAIKLADRLQRMGVNMMRLHHLDAWWSDPNIFDSEHRDTQHLSAEHLDRLDFFMAQLKQRGIYVYWDWLVNRKFDKNDGVPESDKFIDGAKVVAHFDLKIIALEKQYMAQMLNHRNPYTGVRMADEPQIALSEVINEDSLFYEDWYDGVPARYVAELRDICRKYEPAADPGAHPFDKPTLRALHQVETNYYREMRAYLKSLGMRCPTTGSNHWEAMGPELLCDAETDYIDRHYYWDHPKVDFGWFQEFDNLPMLTHYEDGLLPAISAMRVAGKPMVVTEWCLCWMNDTVADGPLIGAAYACRQDWDVMLWFDISHAAPNSAMENEFDIANKPHLFAQWTAAALLFRRQDVAPFPQTERCRIGRDALRDGKSPLDVIDPEAALSRRVEIEIADKSAPAVILGEGKPTEKLHWDQAQGTLTAVTPCSAAFDGFAAGVHDLGWVKATIDSPFCAIWLTSLDGKPLAESHRILVTAAARAQNTGARYNTPRTRLVKPGTAPVLVEPVKAALAFPVPVTVRPLGLDGKPGAAMQTQRLSLGDGRTFWWMIER